MIPTKISTDIKNNGDNGSSLENRVDAINQSISHSGCLSMRQIDPISLDHTRASSLLISRNSCWVDRFIVIRSGM